MRLKIFYTFAFIAFIAAVIFAGCGTTAVTRSTVRERPDSIIVKHDTVFIRAAHSDSTAVQRSAMDTTAARAIHAKLDTTTAAGTHLEAEYQWPEDMWNVKLKEPDEKIRWMVRDSLVEKPYPVESVPFWVYLALGGMAIALIAVIIKK